MKNSFVMYTDYMQHLEIMDMEQRGVFLTAVMKYASGDDLPEMDGMVRMAFSFAKAQMDRDNEQYLKTIEARREAGRQGGVAKANLQKQKIANVANAKQDMAKAECAKQTVANLPDTDNVTVTVTDTVTVNKKDISPEPEKSAPGSRIAGAFVLNDGSMYNVTENDVEQFQQLYPGIDCMQELRNIIGWCDSNPKNRKTRSGAKRFLNAWMSRAQNSAPVRRMENKTPSNTNRFNNFEGRKNDYEGMIWDEIRRRKEEKCTNVN